MTLPRSDAAEFTVLLVCTGNICRSALAERLGRAYLAGVLGDDAGRIRLVSAGTRAVVGSGMHPDSALVLRGLGGEAGDFQATQLVPAHAAVADLVLTMTRAHRRVVLEQAPRMLSRTFTLLEAADVLGRLSAAALLPGDTWRARAESLVREMAAARSGRRAMGEADDIADPIGRPVEAHQSAGDAIAASLLPLLARLAVLVEEGPPRASGRMTHHAVA